MACDMFICNQNKKPFNLLQRIINKDKTAVIQSDSLGKIAIGEHVYQKNVFIEDIQTITRLMKREWFLFQNIAFCDASMQVQDEDLNSARQLICSILESVIIVIFECENVNLKTNYIQSATENLDIFKSLVLSMRTLDNDFVVKFPVTVNNVKNPVSVYFHTFLDINYFLFLFNYCFQSTDIIQESFRSIMNDLILLSKTMYSRRSESDSLYMCNCVKNLWIILQILIDEKDNKLFWTMFNAELQTEDALFSLHLLKEVAYLHTYNNKMEIVGKKCDRVKPNYELLENKMKTILSEADSDMMLNCFKVIEPLICDLWIGSARIEIYQIAWDYYSKRLNVTTKNNHQLNNALEFLELIDIVLWCPKYCEEDFEYFVALLMTHLREYPLQWGKMKGRIYSQLGPNKVKDLTDVGIKHVAVLFFALSSINFDELSKKIVSFLGSLPTEKKNTSLYWNIYTSFIIKHVREGRSIQTVAPNLTKMLQESSSDQKSFHFIKEFIANYRHLINASQSLELHQWDLINEWLQNYLKICYHQDLVLSLNVFYDVIEKVSSPDLWLYWESTYKDHIYPILTQLAESISAPGIVGKLAAKISLLVPSKSKEMFSYFNSENISAKVSSQFLNVTLENYPNNFILTSEHEQSIIRSWIKISLITNETEHGLTRNVCKLDSFRSVINSDIKNAVDPLMDFIEYLGNEQKNVQSMTTIKFAYTCFEKMDTWLTRYLSQPESEAVILRIHTVISKTLLLCGNFLYNKNKGSSPLTQLVTTLLFPSEFLTGKAPHPFILSAIKNTWHVYFEAIVNLNSESDGFLERTQRDLVKKYLPYFSTFDSPMLKCFESEKYSNVIMEMLSTHYFKHPVKESDANMLKVLKIIKDFVESTTSEVLFKILINKVLIGLFEVVIFHSHKNAAIAVIKSITCSQLYCQVKDDFGAVIVAVTEKHLNFNTPMYFQLMIVISRFIPNDLKPLLPKIKSHLVSVERMRGVGFDKTLRLHFEKLEQSLES